MRTLCLYALAFEFHFALFIYLLNFLLLRCAFAKPTHMRLSLQVCKFSCTTLLISIWMPTCACSGVHVREVIVLQMHLDAWIQALLSCKWVWQVCCGIIFIYAHESRMKINLNFYASKSQQLELTDCSLHSKNITIFSRLIFQRFDRAVLQTVWELFEIFSGG